MNKLNRNIIIIFSVIVFCAICLMIFTCAMNPVEESAEKIKITASPIQEIYYSEDKHQYVLVKDSNDFTLAALWDGYNIQQEETYRKLWTHERREWTARENGETIRYVVDSREVILLLTEGKIEYYGVRK